MIVEIKGEKLLLLAEKAIYWERRKVLLAADLHLGKSGHFRKAGVPLPSQIHHDDLDRLSKIIKGLEIEKIYLLGDLFHSVHNSEWNHFIQWRKKMPGIEIHLVKGNHDILNEKDFLGANLILHDYLEDEPFLFYHEHNDHSATGLYQISGHVHPGIRLKGKAKQSVTFPCFYFGESGALLPAFGNFTGHVSLFFEKKDRIFMILNDKIVEYTE